MTRVFNRYSVALLTIIFVATLTGSPVFVSAQSIPQPDQEEVNFSGYTTEELTNQDVFNDFVVGPGKFELELAPGQSRVVELTVSNRMGETKRFGFEIEDTEGSSDGSAAVRLLGSERGPYTLRDYIQIPQMQFDLAHGQRARIPITISLPADAEPGGRYGSVVVSTVSSSNQAEDGSGATSGSVIVSRIGTLFFITSPGTQDRQGSLQSLSILPDKRIYFEGPFKFSLTYENTGNVHTNPYGEIRIYNLFQEEIDFIQLDPWYAMPKSLRSREVEWNRDVLIGRYTAVAQINRGYDNIVDEERISFFVIPVIPLLIVLGSIFAIVLLLRFFFTRFTFTRKQ